MLDLAFILSGKSLWYTYYLSNKIVDLSSAPTTTSANLIYQFEYYSIYLSVLSHFMFYPTPFCYTFIFTVF